MNTVVSMPQNQSQVYAMYKYALISLLTFFTVTTIAQVPAQTAVDGQAETIINPIIEDPLQLEITEWPVPWKDSRPRDPDVAPNGVIWLVGQGGDYAARFDPASEEFTRMKLPPGTGPHNLIVDRDGSLWIAGNRQAFIQKETITHKR
jgi:streptogramin lyase